MLPVAPSAVALPWFMSRTVLFKIHLERNDKNWRKNPEGKKNIQMKEEKRRYICHHPGLSHVGWTFTWERCSCVPNRKLPILPSVLCFAGSDKFFLTASSSPTFQTVSRTQTIKTTFCHKKAERTPQRWCLIKMCRLSWVAHVSLLANLAAMLRVFGVCD